MEAFFDRFDYDSTDQDYSNHPLFWLLFIPQVIPFVELCIYRFPSPLDLTSEPSAVVPLLLVAGLSDYGIFYALNIIYNLFRPLDGVHISWQYFTAASFLRARSFGYRSLGSLLRIDWTDWNRARRVSFLLLLLHPSLIYHTTFQLLFNQDEQNAVSRVPWIKGMIWALMTGSFEIPHNVAKTMGVQYFLILSWLPLPVRAILDSLLVFALRTTIRLLPTLAIGILATLPSILSFVSNLTPRKHLPRIVTDIMKHCQSLDDSALRLRSHLINSVVGWTLKYQMLFSKLWPLRRMKKNKESRGQSRIRLLRVAPMIHGPFEIRCYLERVALMEDNMPRYTAVSYTWGDPTPSRTLIVNGSPVAISDSAYSAVRGLQSLWRHKVIWIDQLCIDQTSLKDKEEQIPLMADIYRMASRIVIWLGASEDGSLAISLIHRLWIWASLNGSTGLQPDKIVTSEAARLALVRMLHNPWFSRTWVVQEVANSSMCIRYNATIIYGGTTLEWKRFAWFAVMVLRSDTVIQELTNGNVVQAAACKLVSDHVTTMSSFSWLTQTTDSRPLLFYLTRMFRTARFQATIAKDRVYAVLALCGLATDQKFAPDYSHSDTQLYIQVAQQIYLTAPSKRRLEFLGHAGLGYNNVTPGLPSWVPDWTVQPKFYPFLGIDGTMDMVDIPHVHTINWNIAQLLSYGEFTYIHANRRPRFMGAQKALDRKALRMRTLMYRADMGGDRYGQIVDETLLLAPGYCFDRIAFLGPIAHSDTHVSSNVLSTGSKPWDDRSIGLASAILDWRKLILDDKLPSYPLLLADFSRAHAFIYTLCGGMTRPWTDITEQETPETQFSDLEISYLYVYLYNFGSSIPRDTVEVNLGAGGASISAEKLRRYNECVRTMCHGRAFGVTTKGRFGLFLPGCQVGDMICVLQGGPTPFVLRPFYGEVKSDNLESAKYPKYQLVGHCYVRGCMHGETAKEGHQSAPFLLV